MTALRTSAPAKVNLGLRVTGRRPDGFHELRSLFLRLDLADDVTLTAATGATDALVVEGDDECPIEGNLALRACAAFRAVSTDAPVPPVAVRLRKRIPMAAGLAGGSSDAAAVLRLLARRHPDAIGDGSRMTLAATLGADVPFFLDAAGAALVSGAGEAIEPLPPPVEPLGVLLARPVMGLSTARVFGAWDALARPSPPDVGAPSAIELAASRLRAGASPSSVVALAPLLRDANDLWPAAVAVDPRMAGVRDALETRLGRPALMSGSGSTLFVLYPDPGEAVAAARVLRDDPLVALSGGWVAASASGTPYPPDIDTLEE